MARKRRAYPLIGWREWVALPELGIKEIKAKIDTGARSSALHAFDLEEFTRKGKPWVRFVVHPVQRSPHPEIECSAPLVDRRLVRSSGGRTTLRPVIHTPVALGGSVWPIEITLVNRDVMGFRMLLGRQAVRGRFLVNPGRSFLNGELLAGTAIKGGRPKKKRRKLVEVEQ